MREKLEELKTNFMESQISLKRITEIANDVKANRWPKSKYTSEEEELWRIFDSVLENGYDMAMRIHHWDMRKEAE